MPSDSRQSVVGAARRRGKRATGPTQTRFPTRTPPPRPPPRGGLGRSARWRRAGVRQPQGGRRRSAPRGPPQPADAADGVLPPGDARRDPQTSVAQRKHDPVTNHRAALDQGHLQMSVSGPPVRPALRRPHPAKQARPTIRRCLRPARGQVETLFIFAAPRLTPRQGDWRPAPGLLLCAARRRALQARMNA